MSLLNRIEEIVKEKGYNLAFLERELGFGNGSIRRWDTSSPSCDKLLKLANFLNVSTDYLLGRNNETTNLKITNLYNLLNQEGQEKLLDYADDLVQSGKYKKDSTVRVGNKAI